MLILFTLYRLYLYDAYNRAVCLCVCISLAPDVKPFFKWLHHLQ